MAKILYSNFMGGLSLYDKNAPENTYWEGREIDPHRGKGYLTTGFTVSNITEASINSKMEHILPDPDTNDIYLLGESDRLWKMSTATTFDGSFDGINPYHDFGSGAGESLAIYPTKIGGAASVKKLFYFWNVSGGNATAGMYDLSSTFDDDWMSTVPTGAGTLVNAPHPNILWKSYLWFGNGQYVGRFDGETGDNGTLDETKLNLGTSVEVTALFLTQNYIGICAWEGSSIDRRGGPCTIYFWDGTSDTYNYSIPIDAIKITAALNSKGVIYLWMIGSDDTTIFGYLSENGFTKISAIQHYIGSTLQKYNPPTPYGVDLFNNKVVMAMGGDAVIDSKASIFSYGRDNEKQPMALTFPWSASVVANSMCGAIKAITYKKMLVSYYDGTNYKVATVSSGNSTTAQYKGNYKDFGQNIQINYVKLYFKPLASGDSVTPTLEVDYGTSVTLKAAKGTANSVASWAADGAITSKKFVPPQGKQKCHTFRPVLKSWTGDVNISKIVVDFSFINDN